MNVVYSCSMLIININYHGLLGSMSPPPSRSRTRAMFIFFAVKKCLYMWNFMYLERDLARDWLPESTPRLRRRRPWPKRKKKVKEGDSELGKVWARKLCSERNQGLSALQRGQSPRYLKQRQCATPDRTFFGRFDSCTGISSPCIGNLYYFIRAYSIQHTAVYSYAL